MLSFQEYSFWGSKNVVQFPWTINHRQLGQTEDVRSFEVKAVDIVPAAQREPERLGGSIWERKGFMWKRD